MRLRHIKGAEERMEESPWVLLPGDDISGITGGKPIRLEIGTGKGCFIIEQAIRHPEAFFVGMERQASALVYAVKKTEAMTEPPENLRFFYGDAEYLEQYYPAGAIEVLYLNFSDPWPKKRHEGRRLPGRRYLQRFKGLLAPQGRIEFKTDNRDLFEYALEELPEAGYETLAVTFDLHSDPELSAGNIMTEYEKKFAAEGVPICKYIAEAE